MFLKILKYIIFTVIAFCLAVYGFFADRLTLNDDTNREVIIDIKDYIDENGKLIQESIKIENETSNKLTQIITFYEEGNEYELKEAIKSEFFIDTSIASKDKIHGYVIAAYHQTGDFKKAAKEILERDKSKTKDDMSLLNDLILVLRGNYITNGLYDTLTYIDQLKEVYNSKLISYFWVFLPVKVNLKLQEDIHYLDPLIKIETKEITKLIKQYPNDQYIEYAYYLIGKYDEALKLRPNSNIKSVLLYASAYNVVKEIKGELLNAKYRLLNSKRINRKIVKNAIRNFTNYIKLYPKNKQSDDAAFWISWLYLYLGDITNSIIWKNKVKSFGNKDYLSSMDSLTLNLLRYKSKEYKIMYMNKGNNHCLNIEIFSDLVKGYSFEELINYIDNNSNQENLFDVGLVYTIQNFLEKFKLNEIEILLRKLEKRDFFNKINDKCGYYSHDKFFKKMLKQIDLIKKAREKGTFNAYKNAAIKLRKNYYYSLSSVFLDEGIQRFQDNMNVDYLYYLQVLAFRDSEFLQNSSEFEFINNLDNHVNYFLKMYPDSNYADDILAEKIFIELMIYNNEKKGFRTLKELFNRYGEKSVFFLKGNALDNALNWYAYYMTDKCRYSYSSNNTERIRNCEYSKKLYTLIKEKFPNTRFYNYAVSNIKSINRRLERIKNKE